MDEMVLATQKWLNKTYGKDNRFTKVKETGHTGWNTVNALLIAMQIELGFENTAPVFGPNTKARFNAKYPNGIKQQNENSTKKSNMHTIIQGALWCKGYSPRTELNGYFKSGMGQAIKELKADMGIGGNSTVTLEVMVPLMNMMQFVLLKSYGGKSSIRNVQQEINRKHREYTGIIPCDGLYGREMNTALIQVLQKFEGYSADVSNGNFGNGTRSRLKTITSSNASSYPDFVWIASAALLCNGYINSTSSNFSEISGAIIEFQKEYVLPVNGHIDVNTWMSLFISKGNPDRAAKACDCATILNKQQAIDLKNAGYTHVGRYLTGYVGQSQPKGMTLQEIANIESAGLRVFPIYQDGGYYLEYFYDSSQGINDAIKAINAAKNIGIPSGTTIYFAVDFDAYEYQMDQFVIPYLRSVNTVFKSYYNSKNYKVGVYGSRLLCTKAYNEGLSKFSFVGDMSTGFSGNLGYPIPVNWSFDQFHEFTFGSSPNFPLDKDAYSRRDKGIASFDKPSTKVEVSNNEKAKLAYISRILNAMELPIGWFSNGFEIGKTIPIGNVSLKVIDIDCSMKFSEGFTTIGNPMFNINVSLDSDGNLSAECKSEINNTVSKLSAIGDDNTSILKRRLTNIALEIGNGSMSVGVEFINGNLAEASIKFSSHDIAPKDSAINIDMTLEFKFKLNVKKINFNWHEINAEKIVIGGLCIALIICALPWILRFLEGAIEAASLAVQFATIFLLIDINLNS